MFSKGFRSPTIRELYMFNHNPNLQPERLFSYETGISKSFLNGKLTGELTGYIANGDNLIVTGAMGNLFNTGEIRNKGIEVAINASPVQNLTLNVAYSYIHMDTPVFATPKHNLFFGGRYSRKKISFSANVQQVNDLDTDITATTKTESYTLVNAKLVYHVTPHLEIFASAENLLDEHYEINRYYPMPGTTYFGGLNYRVGK